MRDRLKKLSITVTLELIALSLFSLIIIPNKFYSLIPLFSGYMFNLLLYIYYKQNKGVKKWKFKY